MGPVNSKPLSLSALGCTVFVMANGQTLPQAFKHILSCIGIALLLITFLLAQAGAADPTTITVQHPDGTQTVLSCRTGSGVVTCRHADLQLTQ